MKLSSYAAVLCLAALVFGVAQNLGQANKDSKDVKKIEEFLEGCRRAGELAAIGAASAACRVLRNSCPVPKDTGVEDFSLDVSSPPPSSIPVIAEGLLEAQLNASCTVEVTETCKHASFNEAMDRDKDCADILQLGPDLKDFVPTGCENITIANNIFNAEVEKICNKKSDDGMP